MNSQKSLWPWVGTLIVVLIIGAPEIHTIVTGTHEPKYLTGTILGRAIVSFVIALIIVGIHNSKASNFHTRVNITALIFGIVSRLWS